MTMTNVIVIVYVAFVIFCTYLSPVYHSTVQYSVNKRFLLGRPTVRL